MDLLDPALVLLDVGSRDRCLTSDDACTSDLTQRHAAVVFMVGVWIAVTDFVIIGVEQSPVSVPIKGYGIVSTGSIHRSRSFSTERQGWSLTPVITFLIDFYLKFLDTRRRDTAVARLVVAVRLAAHAEMAAKVAFLRPNGTVPGFIAGGLAVEEAEAPYVGTNTVASTQAVVNVKVS